MVKSLEGKKIVFLEKVSNGIFQKTFQRMCQPSQFVFEEKVWSFDHVHEICLYGKVLYHKPPFLIKSNNHLPYIFVFQHVM